MGDEMTSSLRRRLSSPAPPAPLEDDDLLAEILLRLPPLPSSLPRASAVSKRWRDLASDPRFCRRFRAHHRRNTPLLGCFVDKGGINFFLPALEAPNRIPEGRFTNPNPIPSNTHSMILGCRHGLMLTYCARKHLLVFDPVTGAQHRLHVPPGFLLGGRYKISGAVLRAARDDRHFQVVLVGHSEGQHTHLVASIYSSETGVWGNLISTPLPSDDSSGSVNPDIPAVMVGDSLYFFFGDSHYWLVEFDFGTCSLGLIPVPEASKRHIAFGRMWVVPAEGGGLGFLYLSGFSAQLWKRNKDCDGVASWVMGRTIALDNLLSIHSEEGGRPFIVGFAEENNVVLLWSSTGIFTVHLESLEFSKLPGSDDFFLHFAPFECVYTADKGIDGGHGGAELPQNI